MARINTFTLIVVSEAPFTKEFFDVILEKIKTIERKIRYTDFLLWILQTC